MQILLNTDKHVEAEPELTQQVQDAVDLGLRRFASQLTRVEVHLSDQNAGPARAADLRCTIEARPVDRQPIAVHEDAATAQQACAGAVTKMRNLLETTFGRAEARQGRDTIRRP